jgi:hypothetical protein
MRMPMQHDQREMQMERGMMDSGAQDEPSISAKEAGAP